MVLTVHNDIDPSYSVVHRQYFDQAIRGIVGTAPKIEQKGDVVVSRFQILERIKYRLRGGSGGKREPL